MQAVFRRFLLTVVPLFLLLIIVDASSHREAPGIARSPQVDGTDFYMFRSYESGRDGFVTLIANYNPLQDPYGGPNYFPLDPDAFYDIHVTNDNNVVEDLTFRFQFNSGFTPQTIPVDGQNVAVPLVNIGPFNPLNEGALSQLRSYTVRLIRGSVDNPASDAFVTMAGSPINHFRMPFDNIGEKSIPDYEAYANTFIHDVQIPGCGNGRLFAGQRKESFAVNLGETFDLVNLNPLGNPGAARSSTEDKNITALALEVPIDCLTEGEGDVIGGWTTARLPRTRTLSNDPTFDQPDSQAGDLVQVSRLGMPLVNELVIGLPDKNLFNASHPRDDATNFNTYFTNPTLPELLELLFGVEAPNIPGRVDLTHFFGFGFPGRNNLTGFPFGEVQRLNTTTPPLSTDNQNRLGLLGGDEAGFPNGRRPGDDVVDITLRVAMGASCPFVPGFCNPLDAPSGLLPFTDQVFQDARDFHDVFPYLTTPLPGSVANQSGICGPNIKVPQMTVGNAGDIGLSERIIIRNNSQQSCEGAIGFLVGNLQDIDDLFFNETPIQNGQLPFNLGPGEGLSGTLTGLGDAVTGYAVVQPNTCAPDDLAVSVALEMKQNQETIEIVGRTSSRRVAGSYGFTGSRRIEGNRVLETGIAMAPCSAGPFQYTIDFFPLQGGPALSVSGESETNLSFLSGDMLDFGGNVEGYFQVTTKPNVMLEALTVLFGSGVKGGVTLSTIPIVQNPTVPAQNP